MTAAAILPHRAAAEGRTSAAPDGIVIARAGATVLSARETHLVLTPVPGPRRPPPKTKGAPSARRMQLVLRDVVAPPETPVYDVYLVLEGPNVFEATVTKLHAGELKLAGKGGEGDDQRATITFDVNDVIAHLAKIRGYNIRHLRVVIARRSAGKTVDAKAAPSGAKPPEIGAIELVLQG